MATKYAHHSMDKLKARIRRLGGKGYSGKNKRGLILMLAHLERKGKKRPARKRKLRGRRSAARKGPRKLKKSGLKTPLRVRKAHQVLRHSKSAAAKKRAMATLRAYNKRQAGSSRRPKITAVHKGILRVPAGKHVSQLPVSHFKKLMKSEGKAEVIRALTNLQRWNKRKEPSLSEWAVRMKRKLRK